MSIFKSSNRFFTLLGAPKVHVLPQDDCLYLELEQNIGTLSVQELFFQLIGWLGVELGVSPVGMVYFMG